MKKIGMQTRKFGYVLGKATNPDKIEEQNKFQKEILEPLLNQAKEEKRAFLLWMQHTSPSLFGFSVVFSTDFYGISIREKKI
jgi:hypothetical protein